MSANGTTQKFLDKRAEAAADSPARSRIAQLLDSGSFMETGLFVKQRPTEFGPSADAAAEAVVTGWGTIDGRAVFVFSQDVSALGGAVSEMHAKKIIDLFEKAGKTGNPVIGIFDSKGARVTEGVDALNGYAEIIKSAQKLSGVVPELAVVLGICGGAAAIAASCFDFVIMSEKAELYMNSPIVVKALTSAKDELATAASCAKSGTAHFTAKDDASAIATAKALLSYLPQNNVDEQPIASATDEINRLVDLGDGESDPCAILRHIADNGEYLDVSSEYGASVTTCLCRFNGATAGVVSNRCDTDAAGAWKAASFVAFCDSFNIPVLTIVNAGGFTVSADFETKGGVIAAARMAAAFAGAEIPKITLITGKAIGSAYIAMSPKGLGADVALAWPSAVIGPLAADAAVTMLESKKLAAADDPKAERAKLEQEYSSVTASPYEAAKRGYIDEIIDPCETRQAVIYALELMSTKRRPEKLTPHSAKSI